jgi:hypothetical protein
MIIDRDHPEFSNRSSIENLRDARSQSLSVQRPSVHSARNPHSG